MAIETVRGHEFIIHFNGSRCIHSRNCVLDRPDVFVPNVKGEWIYPDRASSEAMAQLAHNCPSGAIRYERVDGGIGEEPPLVNTVRVRENGPLAIHAPLTIDGADQGLRATLCRCGQSKKKPYLRWQPHGGRFHCNRRAGPTGARKPWKPAMARSASRQN